MSVMPSPRVYLVGAGPGDPSLITLRGVELLSRADCVLYDSLANDSLLAHARPDAELIYVGKRSGAHSYSQPQISELLLAKARQGRIVVRLKGGDPCMFGRAAEEARALSQAGIPFEIVPGITAGIAAAEYAGIMLTDRDLSSQVVFVTGRQAEGKETPGIDWDLLARFNGSIVFYMGLGNLGLISGELAGRGMSPDTPVCVIENATLPQQRAVRGMLSDIASKAAQAAIGSPAIIIVGRPAASDIALDWFSRRPLRNVRIVITRDSRGNRIFAEKITALGGIPIPFETIRFRSLTESDAFIAALARLHNYDWLIFTSQRGVEAFFDSVAGFGKDARVLGTVKIACVGPETAASLVPFGIRADLVPSVHTGRELARQLISRLDVTGKKMLLLRSAIAQPDLPELLKAAGAVVDDVACYTSEPAGRDASGTIDDLKAGRIDWVTFTSGSTVRGFLSAVDAGLLRSNRARIASIGPVTSAELRKQALDVAAEAAESTVDGILAAIMEMEGRSHA